MSAIRNVAVVGGGGDLGPSIVQGLVDAGFNVKVIGRASSTSSTSRLPAAARFEKVDYADQAALRSAFENQDAVVSTVGSAGIAQQKDLVDAAIAVGVKRFIPSEYGINLQTTQTPIVRMGVAHKLATLEYVVGKAKEHKGFTWTVLSTGLFFDWGLDNGRSEYNYETKTAKIYDSGDKPVALSNVAFIGRAVAGVLLHPQETANKYLCVASFKPTQNEILRILEEETGEKWNVQHLKGADVQAAGEQKAAREDFRAAAPLLLSAHAYADGAGAVQEATANALLGLKEEDPRDAIRIWIAGKRQ